MVYAVLRALCVVGDVHVLRKTLRMANSPVVVSFLSFNNVNTILASVGLDIRVVVSERIDLDRQPRNWSWHAMRPWLYRYADAVTANSHGCPSSKHLGLLGLFYNGGSGSSWIDVKPLVVDGSSGGVG